jgi:hypothetical protein
LHQQTSHQFLFSNLFEMQIKKMDLMENKRINSNSYVDPTQKSNRTMAKFHQNMASADDNSGIPPVPALPPMGETGGHMSKDEFPQIFLGQNSPPGAVAGRKDTPRMMIRMAYCQCRRCLPLADSTLNGMRMRHRDFLMAKIVHQELRQE